MQKTNDQAQYNTGYFFDRTLPPRKKDAVPVSVSRLVARGGFYFWGAL